MDSKPKEINNTQLEPAKAAPRYDTNDKRAHQLSPGPAIADAKHETAVQSPEDKFITSINTNLSVSTTKPNVAMLIDASGSETAGSVSDQLQGILSRATRVRVVSNIADPAVLKTEGFFDTLYGGNQHLLNRAAQISRVDYILMGKATYSFRKQAAIESDLMTCDLILTCRLFDRSGTMVHDDRFSTSGPGFTEDKALENASDEAGQRLAERFLDFIR